MSLQTLIFRRMWAKNDAERDAGLTVPADIELRCNIRYGADKKWNLLDVYRPKNAGGKLPVIVNFHGGGWVYGSKEVYRWYCMSLAQQGFAVVNPSYRLAPEHRFPAAFEDISRVFAFVLRHSEKTGFDTERIFGNGDSAGATGMAAFACLLTNPDYAAQFPVSAPEGLRLRGLGLNCGLYSMNGRQEELRDFLPKKDGEKALRLLHIPAHITEAFPPCFLLTGIGDFNCDEPKQLMPVLEKYGIRCRFRIYGDTQNWSGHVFHCNIRDELAAEANKEEMDFFRSLF